MTLNYAILAVTAVLSATGITGMMRGGVSQGHPFRTVAAVIVFAIALIATLAGIDYVTVKIMIESALGGQ
jgi:VIT1/CCC1 family predicted Fe2+/Mn2+ transporter